MRSCGASYELLRTYKNNVEKDNLWISETTVKLNSLKTVKKMTTKEIEMTVEPSMVRIPKLTFFIVIKNVLG